MVVKIFKSLNLLKTVHGKFIHVSNKIRVVAVVLSTVELWQ